MPELPEVETICNALQKNILDKKFTKITINNPSLRHKINCQIITKIALNQKIIKLQRRAKYILLFFASDKGLCIHLGMTGSFLICSSQEPYQKHQHISFLLNDGKQLRYNDPRRFGFILPFDNIKELTFLQNLGIEPFDKKFTPQFLFQKTKARKKTIKQLLMDNHLVVGIGNIYASEILFLSQISPLRQSNLLTFTQIKIIYKNIIKVLQQAIDKGGSTIKNYSNITGEEGRFSFHHNVYNRKGKKCYKCNDKITKIIQGQRSTFYCPTCQK